METKTHPVKRELPKGWFRFSEKGMREAVLQATAASNLPDGYKAAIAGDIQALPSDNNFVSVHAHRHCHAGKMVSAVDVTGSAILAG